MAHGWLLIGIVLKNAPKEDDGKYFCISCFKHWESPTLPENLKKGCKGNFGILLMSISDNRFCNKERRKRMATRTKSDIHYQCVEQDRISDLKEKIKQENEVKGSEIIETSAVQCLKEFDGSLKFVRTNNLLEILNKDSPTKNDGRQMMFLTSRELLFEKICTTIKQKFQ